MIALVAQMPTQVDEQDTPKHPTPFRPVIAAPNHLV